MESIQDMDRLILKCIWKDEGPRIATRYGRKSKLGILIIPDFKAS